ncbi:sulfatase-like hydrolase/transferase [Lentisphaera profundi]|uniref:Sulfatase-like hydrolase/transferase n=1 Tax=Lentisphaera profundi TaxID=1658616 RepID=A0ABY7VQH3_9BACT|nr:sulfatase-like hydrolase/transferase [Lentisphaera profundi]WDE96438.1 sulfatase-like hydrolase/transferase [Lentisphaera profundi]
MNRLFLTLITFCLFSFAENAKPNVIFILADDMGFGGIHANGTKYLETPHLDNLVAGGMNFTKGISNYPTCKPSRAAIISGLYGSRTHVFRVSNKHKGSEELIRWKVPECLELKAETFNLGRAMKNAGYATASYGKWHVSNQNKSESHPMAFGFDDAIVSSGAHYKFTAIPPVDCPDDVSSTEFFTDKAIEFMDKSVKEEKSFFLFLPFFLVHGPMDCRADYIAHFKEKLKDIPQEKKDGKELHVIAAMTKLLDDCVGKLNNKVKELGIEDNTLIIFTSDNGSYHANLNGGLREKKGQVYEGGMRVPYIFKWPSKIKAGSVSNERICGLDILPTLCELSKSEAPKLDGVSLLPLLSGITQELDPRNIFCFYPKYARFNKKTKTWGDSWRNVIYSGDYKLIDFSEYDRVELFDLHNDEKETKDISPVQPEKAQELKKTLALWLKDTKAPKLTPNKGFSLK